MRSKSKANSQLNFLALTLAGQLNPKHPLYLLAHKIDWDYFEKESCGLYADRGRPAHSIRLMTSLFISKQCTTSRMKNWVEEHWVMNSYFKYFEGLQHQRWGQPCATSDLVHFRQCILSGKTKNWPDQDPSSKATTKRDSAYQKRKKRRYPRRRAAIEPIIGP